LSPNRTGPEEFIQAPRAADVAYVPALICAGVSVVCIRFGFLGFFFLLPLGFAAYRYGGGTPRFCAFLAVLGNIVISVMMRLFYGAGPGELAWDALYVSVMVIGFTWIAAPPESGPRIFRLSGASRFALASLVGALSLAPMMLAGGAEGGFQTFLRAQAEMIASLYTASSGADAEQYITPERIAAYINAAALRGGSAVSCFILFGVSRQLALWFSGLVRGDRSRKGLVSFHVPPALIWVLSGALLGVLAGMKFKVSPLEIAAWNILALSVMLYLVQGGGILLSFLGRLSALWLRLALSLALIMALMSPGLNAVLAGLLILLGIAENWVPFRAPKSNGPSSTPGM
jgi:hypothetical protein